MCMTACGAVPKTGNTSALPETSTDTVPEKAPQDDEFIAPRIHKSLALYFCQLTVPTAGGIVIGH